MTAFSPTRIPIVGVVALALASAAMGVDTSALRPNIVFIMADDLGYGDLGCYGQELIQTPRLDRMAEEGMRFTQHYAGSAVCAPSRAVLMTGMHTGHVFVRGNKQHDGPERGQIPLPAQDVTLPELLRTVGYETVMVGKWGLGNEGTTGDPLDQGFDHYFGYLDQILAHNYYPEYLLRNGEKVYLDNDVKYLSEDAWHRGLGSVSTRKDDYAQDRFMEEALGYLEEDHAKPFFLYLPFTMPHDNGEAPVGERFEVPDLGRYADEDWHADAKGYAAMVTLLDRDVGRILDKLREEGLAENTVVFFTSDNGPLPEDRPNSAQFDSNGDLRGGKRYLTEGGIRVPLIAWWPGRIEAGAVSDHVSAAWDFLPTFAELSGHLVPDWADGLSLAPELLGLPQEEHEYLYWEFPIRSSRYPTAVAVRMGKWKGIRLGVDEEGKAPLELYDLSKDPGEENNVAAGRWWVARKIARIMEEAHWESEEFPLYAEEMAGEAE